MGVFAILPSPLVLLITNLSIVFCPFLLFYSSQNFFDRDFPDAARLFDELARLRLIFAASFIAVN